MLAMQEREKDKTRKKIALVIIFLEI